jgi:hypothetical protein
VQSVSSAIDRNVTVKTLNDPKLDYPSFFKVIEGVQRDVRPNFSNFFVEPDEKFRKILVPFSFVVIDHEIALFEVPNKQFKLAFSTMDGQIIRVLEELFWELWQNSTSLNVPDW